MANTIDEIAGVFRNHVLAQSLGYELCRTMPVGVVGRVSGPQNCLHLAGRYAPEKAAASQALSPLRAMAFLRHDFQRCRWA